MTHFHLAGVLLGIGICAALFDWSVGRAFFSAGVTVLLIAALARARH